MAGNLKHELFIPVRVQAVIGHLAQDRRCQVLVINLGLWNPVKLDFGVTTLVQSPN